MYYFSLVCTFRKAIKNFEAKVNISKKGGRSFIQLMFNDKVKVDLICNEGLFNS
jgi:hypothetical protein